MSTDIKQTLPLAEASALSDLPDTPQEKILRPRIYSEAQTVQEYDQLFDDELEKAYDAISQAVDDGRLGSATPPPGKSNESSNSSPDTPKPNQPTAEAQASPWTAESTIHALQITMESAAAMMRLARRRHGLTHHEAEDAVAIAQMRFLNRINKGRFAEAIEDERQIEKLFTMFVTYAAIDQFRAKHGRRGQMKPPLSLERKNLPGETSLSDILLEIPDSGNDESALELLDQFKRVLPRLSPAERQAVLLTGYLDFSLAEAALVLDTSAGAINQRLVKIRKKLHAQGFRKEE